MVQTCMNMEFDFSEEWLPINGFEGSYEISNFGRVRSLSRIITERTGKTYRIKGRLMRQTLCCETGYLKVDLSKNGKGKPWPVHILVTAAFLGQCPQGCCVDHKDGQKQRNVAGNLEYITSQEQIRRAIAMGLHQPQAFRRKLSSNDLIEIRRLSVEGVRSKEIAMQFGVTRQHIVRILNGKRRTP